ncbi:recombination-associated protein RdgC [Propionivibrio limicola]|uniref:recombination-associated protein RdgC n=1 Tax=Propionivibrio limicola TaxID=167645 RepID=UPI001291A30B|nr:recombination-associated protein RdgC [Propionivibrio limicola]
MWFKNIQLYRLPKNRTFEITEFEDQLARLTLQPCNASDEQSIGWIPPREGGPLVHSVNRQWLLALGAEQKLLPASVVKQFANDRAKAIEESEGRRVGRKEMRELREAMTQELLPRAFVRKRTTFGWIDPEHGWLAVDASSPAKAEEFLECLYKVVDGFAVRPVKVQQSPSGAMTAWVADGSISGAFTIDQDLELRSSENAMVRYAKHSLDGDEIRQHIMNGKVVTRLAMTWNDKISFVLNEGLQLKRLGFLDVLQEQAEGLAENEEERLDIDFTLMTGELAQLFDHLIEALGGEMPQES